MQALSFLIEVMSKLMDDPGQFENIQKELTSIFIEFSDNQHVMSNGIELIFNQVSFRIIFIWNNWDLKTKITI